MDKVQVLAKQHHHLLEQTIFRCTAAFKSTRTTPRATVLAAVMEAALTGTSSMLSMYCLLYIFCISRLRGAGSCGSRHGLAPRSGAGNQFWAVRF